MEFLQLLISGVAQGCIYGLIALGFVLIYKATETVSFVQGDLMMLGAFCGLGAMTFLGFPFWLSVVSSIVAMGLAGVALERIVIRPILGQPAFSIVMLTIGIGYVLRGLITMIPVMGTDTHVLPVPYKDAIWTIGALVLNVEQVVVIVFTALLCLLVWLPNRTSMLIIMLAVPAAALHQWRQQRLRIAMAVLATAVVSTLFVTTVPQVRQTMLTGLSQVEQGLRGEVTRESWNIRVQLIRHTTDMIAERPWMGWGIGAWNDQWRARVPVLADINMPHNDFLWTGSQAGIPGALLWISIPLAACWIGWRRRDLTGRLAFVAALTMLCAALVNSAMRDGVIGLALLWIVGLYLRLANDPHYHFDPRRPAAAA